MVFLRFVVIVGHRLVGWNTAHVGSTSTRATASATIGPLHQRLLLLLLFGQRSSVVFIVFACTVIVTAVVVLDVVIVVIGRIVGRLMAGVWTHNGGELLLLFLVIRQLLVHVPPVRRARLDLLRHFLGLLFAPPELLRVFLLHGECVLIQVRVVRRLVPVLGLVHHQHVLGAPATSAAASVAPVRRRVAAHAAVQLQVVELLTHRVGGVVVEASATICRAVVCVVVVLERERLELFAAALGRLVVAGMIFATSGHFLCNRSVGEVALGALKRNEKRFYCSWPPSARRAPENRPKLTLERKVHVNVLGDHLDNVVSFEEARHDRRWLGYAATANDHFIGRVHLVAALEDDVKLGRVGDKDAVVSVIRFDFEQNWTSQDCV